MIKRILNLIAATTLGLLLLNVAALNVPAYADSAAGPSASYGLFGDTNTPAGDACDGLSQLGDTQCGSTNGQDNGQSKIEKFAGDIVNILSIVAGIAAVIMIIVAGIRYTTSGGDSNATSGAKNALVYALIGIAIAALAQVLVHFVLSASNVK
jgi:hypothetical protein